MSARTLFATLLANYRNRAGWTQAEAADKFHMSRSNYQKLESCDRKPQREFAILCDETYNTPDVFISVYADMVTEPYSAWFGPRVEYEDRAAVGRSRSRVADGCRVRAVPA